MIDPLEKSTEVPPAASRAGAVEVSPGVMLDSRRAIVHREEGWMALSDLHYGYEVSRRRDGGLWPLWGMDEIEQRLRGLVEDWKPERVVLVGDVVDSSAAPDEAVAWLESLMEIGAELILVAGNHDRGAVRREFDFVEEWRIGQHLFHHGHLDSYRGDAVFEITGHFHPSMSFRDGAGTSLRLPAFTRERFEETGQELWRLPAFSPWAGGHPCRPVEEGSEYGQWVCGEGRVFAAVSQLRCGEK